MPRSVPASLTLAPLEIYCSTAETAPLEIYCSTAETAPLEINCSTAKTAGNPEPITTGAVTKPGTSIAIEIAPPPKNNPK
ncbi:hypothetical protein FOMA001_g2058 [Fusarium oxysporum f. sp. matthiolae]|nr:hypothetical protein FOMA001_g2058 [Fusarium oxysporum f. sp. matthiolae]